MFTTLDGGWTISGTRLEYRPEKSVPVVSLVEDHFRLHIVTFLPLRDALAQHAREERQEPNGKCRPGRFSRSDTTPLSGH